MRAAAIIASAISFLVALAWLINSPALDSAATTAAAFAALITSLLLVRPPKTAEQSQSVSDSSVGIQARRDVNIRDISKQ